MTGWRYRWVEMSHKLAERLVKQSHDWKSWKGTLPVVVVNGMWLEVGNSDFAPWPISKPKKMRDIIVGEAATPKVEQP